jgi:organic radical activating enzyme
MFGENKIRKIEKHDGFQLAVQEIFKTIQGEGPLVGTPSIFIRLGGCNLACSFCDANFEDFEYIDIEKILDTILALSLNDEGKKVIPLVVITGGEPLRQPIELLCSKLLSHNFKVQIETNGTIYRELPSEILIVCSPKATNGRYYPIREDFLQKITTFKFLIAKNLIPYNSVPELGQSQFNIPTYIQAIDQYNKALNEDNIKHTLDIACQYGYIVSLQIHKILNIP